MNSKAEKEKGVPASFIYSLIQNERNVRYENKLGNKINLWVKSPDLPSPIAQPP